MSAKGKNVKVEKSFSDSLDEIIEMKKNENSALKKIFDSLNTTKGKENNKS